jgi:hypothetical protein
MPEGSNGGWQWHGLVANYFAKASFQESKISMEMSFRNGAGFSVWSLVPLPGKPFKKSSGAFVPLFQARIHTKAA